MTDKHDCHCDDIEHHINPDRTACECDDQLPAMSMVGRGIKGDSFYVRISDPDDCTQTYLEGLSFDEATKEFTSEWISENINGGELSYQYNLRPFQEPMTFTVTFIYRRPGRCEWSWTTPAIPYVWSIDSDGNKDDAEAIVGSGVATLFMRTSKDDPWDVEKHEKLLYPPGTNRNDYNAPLPEKGWTVNITFGKGGDVEIPNFKDLADVLGMSEEDIDNILEGKGFDRNGTHADNVLDYVDKQDQGILDHVHKDLGFGNGDTSGDSGSGSGSGNPSTNPDHGSGSFGGQDSVKDYIDKKTDECMEHCRKALEDFKKEFEDWKKEMEDWKDEVDKKLQGLSDWAGEVAGSQNGDLQYWCPPEGSHWGREVKVVVGDHSLKRNQKLDYLTVLDTGHKQYTAKSVDIVTNHAALVTMVGGGAGNNGADGPMWGWNPDRPRILRCTVDEVVSTIPDVPETYESDNVRYVEKEVDYGSLYSLYENNGGDQAYNWEFQIPVVFNELAENEHITKVTVQNKGFYTNMDIMPIEVQGIEIYPHIISVHMRHLASMTTDARQTNGTPMKLLVQVSY